MCITKSLVVLFSSWQHHLEFNLQEVRESWAVFWQGTKPNSFVSVKIASIKAVPKSGQ